jgi:hypothetical protein
MEARRVGTWEGMEVKEVFLGASGAGKRGDVHEEGLGR